MSENLKFINPVVSNREVNIETAFLPTDLRESPSKVLERFGRIVRTSERFIEEIDESVKYSE